jgi:hypothetical protein
LPEPSTITRLRTLYAISKLICYRMYKMSHQEFWGAFLYLDWFAFVPGLRRIGAYG